MFVFLFRFVLLCFFLGGGTCLVVYLFVYLFVCSFVCLFVAFFVSFCFFSKNKKLRWVWGSNLFFLFKLSENFSLMNLIVCMSRILPNFQLKKTNKLRNRKVTLFSCDPSNNHKEPVKVTICWLVGWLVGCFMTYQPFSCHLTPN